MSGSAYPPDAPTARYNSSPVTVVPVVKVHHVRGMYGWKANTLVNAAMADRQSRIKWTKPENPSCDRL